MWKTLTYGPKRSCVVRAGDGVIDIPQTGEYDGGGCSHIIAFYAGARHRGQAEASRDHFADRVARTGPLARAAQQDGA